jgi:hypothetical protein
MVPDSWLVDKAKLLHKTSAAISSYHAAHLAHAVKLPPSSITSSTEANNKYTRLLEDSRVYD